MLSIQHGTCLVEEGSHADPHVTLSMAGRIASKVLSGQLSGPAIVMSGRLRISGDVGLPLS